jgi:hypothetical protein
MLMMNELKNITGLEIKEMKKIFRQKQFWKLQVLNVLRGSMVLVFYLFVILFLLRVSLEAVKQVTNLEVRDSILNIMGFFLVFVVSLQIIGKLSLSMWRGKGLTGIKYRRWLLYILLFVGYQCLLVFVHHPVKRQGEQIIVVGLYFLAFYFILWGTYTWLLKRLAKQIGNRTSFDYWEPFIRSVSTTERHIQTFYREPVVSTVDKQYVLHQGYQSKRQFENEVTLKYSGIKLLFTKEVFPAPEASIERHELKKEKLYFLATEKNGEAT